MPAATAVESALSIELASFLAVTAELIATESALPSSARRRVASTHVVGVAMSDSSTPPRVAASAVTKIASSADVYSEQARPSRPTVTLTVTVSTIVGGAVGVGVSFGLPVQWHNASEVP